MSKLDAEKVAENLKKTAKRVFDLELYGGNIDTRGLEQTVDVANFLSRTLKLRRFVNVSPQFVAVILAEQLEEIDGVESVEVIEDSKIKITWFA